MMYGQESFRGTVNAETRAAPGRALVARHAYFGDGETVDCEAVTSRRGLPLYRQPTMAQIEGPVDPSDVELKEACSCAHILIVDDNTFNIYTLKLMIEMKNPSLICDQVSSSGLIHLKGVQRTGGS